MSSRPYSAGGASVTVGTGGPATWGGKLQIIQPSHNLELASGGRRSIGPAGRRASVSFGDFAAKRAPLGKSASLASLKERAIAEVRALGREDDPDAGNISNSHDKLMLNLKSRTARVEAENAKQFLSAYRSATGADRAAGNAAQQDAQLDAMIRAASARSETLRAQNMKLNDEFVAAKEKFDQYNSMDVARASDHEMQGMSRLERSQRRVTEDKQEQELQKKRDDAQAKYTKAQRQMQTELTELRDYMLLLQEYKGLRLEKLEDTLAHTRDGTNLRSIVRQMLRNGATRLTQKLENTVPQLEPWMRDVIVNMCHIELQIEDGEEELLRMRQAAVKPVEGHINHMRLHSQGDRVDGLCAATWSAMQDIRMEHHLKLVGGLEDQFGNPALTSMVSEDGLPIPPGSDPAPVRQYAMPAKLIPLAEASKRELMSPKTVSELRTAEAEVLAKRRLLADMRKNVAAVVCNRMHQEEKRSGSSAREWAQFMIALMVSHSFAKTTMKEVQKAAPQGRLTQ